MQPRVSVVHISKAQSEGFTFSALFALWSLQGLTIWQTKIKIIKHINEG